jgi:hypothetical protein
VIKSTVKEPLAAFDRAIHAKDDNQFAAAVYEVISAG